MKSVRAILFDLGGVLYEIDFSKMERAFQQLNPNLSVSIFSPESQVEITYPYEKGLISTETFLSGLQKYFPGVQKDELIEAWNSLLIGLYPHAIPLLEFFSERYPVYLLSNINDLHYEAALPEIEKIKPYFKECFFSCEIGYRKPEVEAFQYVLNQIEQLPEEVLFIDDSTQNVQAALKMGLQAIHFSGKSLDELLKVMVKIDKTNIEFL